MQPLARLTLLPVTLLAAIIFASQPHQQAPLTTMSTNQVITDVLPSHRSVQIFTSLIRDVPAVSQLLSSSSSSQNFTVLAPTNHAMSSLDHKPWEDPAEYKELGTNAYEGDAGKERAQRNIQRFVEAHVVAKAPWAENDKARTLVAGEGESEKAVWWEDAGDGKRKIAPDGVGVESVAARVKNGEVWVLDGVLKP